MSVCVVPDNAVVVEITNLNRIRAYLADVGTNKTSVAAREVWRLDPFADLFLWDKGISTENIKDFLFGEPKLDVFIDEMDSLDLKVAARLLCKENKIPVVMGTDNGDSVILDVERFDLEENRPIFHGLVDGLETRDLKKLDFKGWVEIATSIVGQDYLEDRMRDSLQKIGKTISAVPQLGATAAIAGSTVAYAVRRIANKQEMESGRYLVGMKEKKI